MCIVLIRRFAFSCYGQFDNADDLERFLMEEIRRWSTIKVTYEAPPKPAEEEHVAEAVNTERSPEPVTPEPIKKNTEVEALEASQRPSTAPAGGSHSTTERDESSETMHVPPPAQRLPDGGGHMNPGDEDLHQTDNLGIPRPSRPSRVGGTSIRVACCCVVSEIRP